MLGQERIRELADRILDRSTADQTEVVVLSSDNALTRFANSTIHQNVYETDTEVRIRAVMGTRIGVATTNDLREEALVATLERAIETARLSPENPDFRSLPEPQPIAEADAFRSSTADCTPEGRANGAGTICLLARDAGMVASGALTTAANEVAVANSLGIWAYHPFTQADVNTVIMSDTSAGYAAALAMDYDDLDCEAIGREALDKCIRSQNPRALPPGDYPIVLEPFATQDFVQMMGYTGLSAQAVQEGRSFMAGKLGEQIVDRRVSIWDDGLDPNGIPLPFDFEGVPKQRVDFIVDGVAKGVVYDSYTAGKEPGKHSTGHALPAPNALGPFPVNTFFGAGEATLEEMVAGTKRGLYVTRFHYTRPVEPKRVTITGMTRDGTFMIENGEIAYPIKNLRFTQSYLEALNHVEAIGRETRLLEAWSFVVQSVPALKLAHFNFTGATEF